MAATDSTRCLGCGAELSAAARFCSICGKDRYAAASTPSASANTTGSGTAAPLRGGSNTGLPSSPNRTGTYPPTVTSTMPAYTSPLPPIGGAAAQNGNRKILLASVAGFALMLLAGLFFANAAGLLNANKTTTPTTGVLNAPPTQVAPAPILNVPPTAAPPSSPILQPPATVGNPMPEDVIAYLRWLKKFETARRDLATRNTAVLTTAVTKMIKGTYDLGLQMSEPDTIEPKLKAEYDPMPDVNRVLQEWNGAAGLFQQRVPPNPCAPLAQQYRGALNGSVSSMTRITTTIASMQTKSSGSSGSGGDADLMTLLTDLRGEHGSKSMSQNVDATYETANAALDSLRDRYTDIPNDISKGQFDVKEESRGSVPTPSLPGFG